MRGSLKRVRIAALCTMVAVTLAGCESFDPGTLMDWIPDGKKKLQGERKEIFPNGVPGVPQGVPPELVKGNQPPPDAALATADPAAQQPVAEPPVEERQAEQPKPKPKPKAKTAARASKPATVTVGPAPGQPNQSTQAAASPWPAPAQQQQQQQTQSQSNWPAPPPAGSFSR